MHLPLFLPKLRRRANRLVVGLTAARGENNLASLGADGRRNLCSGFLQNLLRTLPCCVQARRVAPGFADHFCHRIHSRIAHFCGSGIVCINHGGVSFLDFGLIISAFAYYVNRFLGLFSTNSPSPLDLPIHLAV